MRRVVVAVAVLAASASSLAGVPSAAATVAAPRWSCPAAPYGIHREAPAVAGGGRTVALTFDDGPGPSTRAILSILEQERVRATFFNLGSAEADDPGAVRAEESAGFLVANHTWSHVGLRGLSSATQAGQMDGTIAAQRALVGTTPCAFRPPYGAYDSTTLSLASARHMGVWLWNVDTEDWKAGGSGSSYWVDRIVHLAESEGGALAHPVILLHNQAIAMPATVAALPTIIGYFKARGYRFVDLLGRAGAPQGCGTGPPATATATTLKGGTGLVPGASATSPGGQYRLVMQRDGNLVFYVASRALWSSGTAGHPGARAFMQRDGNFVVYSASGAALWSTRTSGHAGATLQLRSSALFGVVSSAGALVWSSRSSNSRLAPGEALRSGWYLLSPASACRLSMQADGNLVLRAQSGAVLWQTGPHAGTKDAALLQRDGNLVISSELGTVVWSSGTAGHAGVSLYVTRDGTVLLETAEGSVPWFR